MIPEACPLIRPALPADLPLMVELLSMLFHLEADFTPDPVRQLRGLTRMMEDKGRCLLLVAEESGSVTGMGTAQLVISTSEGGLSAWIEDLIVLPGYRGRGTGRSLLNQLLVWAEAAGATRFQLLADRKNQPALDFYHRLGWEEARLLCLRGPALRR